MRVALTERSTIDRIGGINTFIFEISEAFLKIAILTHFRFPYLKLLLKSVERLDYECLRLKL